jgi:(+)-neomenthol dehydrogenase
MAAYTVSKAALNAYSRVLVPPEEGAARVVAVALLPAGGPTGAYFQDREQAPFV